MKRSMAIKNLASGQKLKGEIVLLFRPKNTGIIRGDDGYDVGFHALSVVGATYRDLCLGERVIYQLSFPRNGKIPTAMNVHPDRCSEMQAKEVLAGVDEATQFHLSVLVHP